MRESPSCADFAAIEIRQLRQERENLANRSRGLVCSPSTDSIPSGSLTWTTHFVRANQAMYRTLCHHVPSVAGRLLQRLLRVAQARAV